MLDYKKEYERWLASDALNADEKAELQAIAGDEKEIESRFYGPLEFGTAGLRGTMKVGLHQMNVHVIRWATQGFADVIAAEGETLRGPADHMDIHLMQSRLHGAPQSGGAEFQRAKKAGFDLLGIIADRFQLRLFLGGEGGACEPFFVFLHEIHLQEPPVRMLFRYGGSADRRVADSHLFYNQLIRKASQSFTPAGAKAIKSVLCRDMCVT